MKTVIALWGQAETGKSRTLKKSMSDDWKSPTMLQ
jgi:hypothetical protein